MDAMKSSLCVAVFILAALSIPCSNWKSGKEIKFDKCLRATPTEAKIKSSTDLRSPDHMCSEGCGDPTHYTTCFASYCEKNHVCGYPMLYDSGYASPICCPPDHPVYFKYYNVCCPIGYSFVCGKYCCNSEHGVCCNSYGYHAVDNCCEIEEQCCNSEECCNSKSPCCRKGSKGVGTCCSRETMACCDGECGPPCSSQFDVLPCVEASDKNSILLHYLTKKVEAIECPNRLQTGVLYRPLRSDESCDGRGLLANDPTAVKTVLSHVSCGGKTFMNYTSQYISFSTSLDVLTKKYLKPGGRIAEVRPDELPARECTIYDLTLRKEREDLLKKAVIAKKYAAASCLVLLWCFPETHIPCKIVHVHDQNHKEL